MPPSPSGPSFPPGFFDRADDADDAVFYEPARLVTHIDDGAIEAVGALYRTLEVNGDVLDLMSSWISHFDDGPTSLVALGMNEAELARNPMATGWVVHDLNADPTLPFPDASFDDVTCCVSVDYLTRPVEVFVEVARVLRPGGRFIVTYGNRCFPTKAIRGWLETGDRGHAAIITAYFEASGAFGAPTARRCTPETSRTDPLFTVYAPRR